MDGIDFFDGESDEAVETTGIVFLVFVLVRPIAVVVGGGELEEKKNRVEAPMSRAVLLLRRRLSTRQVQSLPALGHLYNLGCAK